MDVSGQTACHSAPIEDIAWSGTSYDLNLWIGDPFEGATYLPR